jgi:hypothetical protein
MPAQGVIIMAGMLVVRRSRGALSGVLLVLLGLWGALIPYVGPYFHYAYTPDRAWVTTAGRMWLEILPGAVTLIAGVVVLISRFRPAAALGAWLAALAGAWFAVGSLIAATWHSLPRAGTPVGGSPRAAFEQIGFFTGLGVVILFVAALALGRLTVIAARDKVKPDDHGPAHAASGAPTSERVPGSAAAGQTGLAGTAGRAAARVMAVPVFRGKQRSTAANVAAGRAGAEADIAGGRTR